MPLDNFISNVLDKHNIQDGEERENIYEMMEELGHKLIGGTRPEKTIKIQTTMEIDYNYPFEIQRSYSSTPVCDVNDLINIMNKFKEFGAIKVGIEVTSNKRDKYITFKYDGEVESAQQVLFDNNT